MNDLFDKWIQKIPNFDKKFKPILEEFANYGGGSVEIKEAKAKYFSNAYEFYIYSFFIGLYNNQFKQVVNSTNFSHQIKFWGNTNKIGRKDFSSIQKYLFASVVDKTEIDMIALEKGEILEDEIVKILIKTLEGYANGGMNLIKERHEDNNTYFYTTTGFLRFLLDSCKSESEED